MHREPGHAPDGETRGVTIHPLTGDSVDDHSIYAMWLGSPVPLKLNTLRRSYRAELLPSA